MSRGRGLCGFREITSPRSFTTTSHVAALAFGMLWVATLLILARDTTSWASLPPLLLLATYSAYLVKYTTASKETYERMNDAARVLRAAFFCLVIIWPFPTLHWYDAFAMLALLLTTNDLTAGNLLLALYYSISAASHAAHGGGGVGGVLQVAGRTVLGAVAGLALHHQPA